MYVLRENAHSCARLLIAGKGTTQQAYLPTPLAAFTPAAPPDEPFDDLADPPADPAPMAQSSVPDLDWLSLGKDTLFACWNTPTERDRVSRDLNQSSISRVGSNPAMPNPVELLLSTTLT